jgi:MFS family permease
MTGPEDRPETGAVVAVASVITAAFMGSVVITPLYPLYQKEFGFSDMTLTLVYAAYVVGNLAALLLLGRVSDIAGRKRVTLPALAVAGASALLFLFAQDTAWLYAGRLVIGLAVGVLSGTGTAWLAELFGPARRPSATVTAATANLTGIAVGPLLGGVLAQYAPSPLHHPFVIYFSLLCLVSVAIIRTADTRQPSIHTLGRLRIRPRLGVPRDRWSSFAAPAVTGFVIFALGGLYFALIPTIVIRDLHRTNAAVAGLVVFTLGTTAALCLLLSRRLRPVTAMVGGLVSLLPAVALVVSAQAVRSMPLLLLASALAGVAMSLGYRGSLEVVNEIAPDNRRAEVVSSYFIACFVGNSVPVVGLGVLSTFTRPLYATAVFACTVGAFALAALAWHRRDRKSKVDRLEH